MAGGIEDIGYQDISVVCQLPVFGIFLAVEIGLGTEDGHLLALVTRNSEERKVLDSMKDTILEELNVKEVIFHEREDELVEYKAKANFKVLGKQLGGKMKLAAAEIAKLSGDKIAEILDNKAVSVTVDGIGLDFTEGKLPSINTFEFLSYTGSIVCFMDS